MKRKKGRSRHDDGSHREGDDADEHAKKKAKKATTIPDICDDALLGIFSRLTSREAVRCATLSKRHRQLIYGMDFWHLHHRLGPPLPQNHVAYLATVGASDPTTKKNIRSAGSVFLDFHLAVAGGDDDNNDELRYSLVDRRRMYSRYVGTCNGVILMAQSNGASSSSILLFNPAVAGGEEEVELELPAGAGRRYRVVGFGYGPSSRLHKLLLTREELDDPTSRTRGGMSYRAKELFVYTLGGSASHPRLRSVMSELDAEISDTSVYLNDGKIYLLAGQSRVLAFDVDDESVTAIDLPDGTAPLKRSELMEVSGRLCVATGTGYLSLWLLMADHQWERLGEEFRCGGTATKLTGAWDCGGVMVLYFKHKSTKAVHLQFADTRNSDGTVKKLLTPRPVEMEQGGGGTELVMCWGYKPTLVSPGRIADVDAPPRRHSGGGGGVVAALEPMIERDVSAGRGRTLESVRFMNLLLYIMTKLPDEKDDVIEELRRKSLPFSLR